MFINFFDVNQANQAFINLHSNLPSLRLNTRFVKCSVDYYKYFKKTYL